jgi:hypothetical protein
MEERNNHTLIGNSNTPDSFREGEHNKSVPRIPV